MNMFFSHRQLWMRVNNKNNKNNKKIKDLIPEKRYTNEEIKYVPTTYVNKQVRFSSNNIIYNIDY